MPEKQPIQIQNGRIAIPEEWRGIFNFEQPLSLTYWFQNEEPTDEIRTFLWQFGGKFADALEKMLGSRFNQKTLPLRYRIYPCTSYVQPDKTKEGLILPKRLLAILGHTRASLHEALIAPSKFGDAFKLTFSARRVFRDTLEKEVTICQTRDNSPHIDPQKVEQSYLDALQRRAASAGSGDQKSV